MPEGREGRKGRSYWGCGEIQKPLPEGKATHPCLQLEVRAQRPSPALSPLQNSQGDKDQDAGRPKGAWATTDTERQADTDRRGPPGGGC